MERITALYHVTSTAAAIETRAAALALEQSIEMPLEAVTSAFVRDHIVARVEAIEELASGRFAVTLGIAADTVDGDAGQLLNMLFGNCSLQEDVALVDAAIPAALARGFGGPRFGIAGIRERVRAAPGRALTMTALKPQGLAPGALGGLCKTFAHAGIDIIKDDHGIADQRYAPFAARVGACQRAIGRANTSTGGYSVYAPALSGGPRQIKEQLRIVRAEGVGMVLACPLILGLPVFQELVRHEFDCPVIAHPALGGANRIHPALLFGRLFRLLGADATIFPNHGGRFSYSPEICQAIADAARAPWEDLRACAPVPAGGMSLARIPEMVDFYGTDTILLIGGALLSGGVALAERSRAFVRSVHAAGTGVPNGGALHG